MMIWIRDSYIVILRKVTFYWCILFFYIVGWYGGKGIIESLGFSIGVSLFLATIAIFLKWLESKQN
jgi:hypothetical protein